MFPFINIAALKIPSYGLFMIIGMTVSLFFVKRRVKENESSMENYIIIMAVSVGLAILGGRILYILITYRIIDLINFLKNGDFQFVFESGLVFVGGLIGGIFGAVLSIICLKENFAEVERSIVPFVPIGHAFGRIGCFMAGCCHGMEYSGIGAVYYKNSVLGLSSDVGYFPVQLVEAFLNFVITTILLSYSKKKPLRGEILFLYVLLYSTVRFVLEFARGDLIRGIYGILSTSQWISVALIIVSIVGIFSVKKKNNKIV